MVVHLAFFRPIDKTQKRSIFLLRIRGLCILDAHNEGIECLRIEKINDSTAFIIRFLKIMMDGMLNNV